MLQADGYLVGPKIHNPNSVDIPMAFIAVSLPPSEVTPVSIPALRFTPGMSSNLTISPAEIKHQIGVNFQVSSSDPRQ
jgi:hypothetical protein